MIEAMNQGKSGMHPKISIGMPVFNGVPFIREAIGSLLAQTFTDFELIISDNGSTDGTEAICREYAASDARIRYVRQSNNRGGLFNFQFVLDAARGEYFMWAAHDDWWSPNWVEELYYLMSDDVVIAYGASVKTKENLDVDGKIKLYNISSSYQSLRLMKYFFLDENGKGNPYYGLMRTEIIRNHGIYKSGRVEYGQDYRHIFSLLRHGKLVSSHKTIQLKRNTQYGGVRGLQCGKLHLVILFLFEFVHVIGPDRLRYYFEFVKIAPTLLQKLMIVIFIPVKIVQGLLLQYTRSFKRGIILCLKNVRPPRHGVSGQ